MLDLVVHKPSNQTKPLGTAVNPNLQIAASDFGEKWIFENNWAAPDAQLTNTVDGDKIMLLPRFPELWEAGWGSAASLFQISFEYKKTIAVLIYKSG